MTCKNWFAARVIGEKIVKKSCHRLVRKHIGMKTPAMVWQIGYNDVITNICQILAYAKPMFAHAEPTMNNHQCSALKRAEFSVKEIHLFDFGVTLGKITKQKSFFYNTSRCFSKTNT